MGETDRVEVLSRYGTTIEYTFEGLKVFTLLIIKLKSFIFCYLKVCVGEKKNENQLSYEQLFTIYEFILNWKSVVKPL